MFFKQELKRLELFELHRTVFSWLEQNVLKLTICDPLMSGGPSVLPFGLSARYFLKISTLDETWT